MINVYCNVQPKSATNIIHRGDIRYNSEDIIDSGLDKKEYERMWRKKKKRIKELSRILEEFNKIVNE